MGEEEDNLINDKACSFLDNPSFPSLRHMLFMSFTVFSEIEDPDDFSKLTKNRLAMTSAMSFNSTTAKPPFHLQSSVCPVCLSGP